MTNEFISFLIEDGVLIARFHPGAVIDFPAAEKVLEDRLKFSSHKSFPVLVDARGVKSITKDARDLLSSDKGRIGVKATAILADSYLSSTLANFFLYVTVKKPLVPTKIFSNRAKAIAWLKKH